MWTSYKSIGTSACGLGNALTKSCAAMQSELTGSFHDIMQYIGKNLSIGAMQYPLVLENMKMMMAISSICL